MGQGDVLEILEKSDKPLDAKTISIKIGVTLKNVSLCLKKLERTGFIKSEKICWHKSNNKPYTKIYSIKKMETEK